MRGKREAGVDIFAEAFLDPLGSSGQEAGAVPSVARVNISA